MKRFLSRWLARWRHAPDESAIPTGATGTGGVAQTPTPPMAPMLDCEAVIRQLWDYLDGELTPERMAAIRAHLELCKRCYPQYEFERSFLNAVAGTARQHSDLERLRSQLLETLEAKGLGHE
jgi:anti-sigma factor (TIGR02949 family)